MSTFLTLAVYSLKVSSDFPTESLFFPIISIYFIIGIAHTLLSLGWFTISNYTKEKQVKPYWWINALANLKTFLDGLISKLLKIMFPSKSADKIAPKKNEPTQPVDLMDFKHICPNCDLCINCIKKKQNAESKNELKKEIDFKCAQVNKIMFTFILLSSLVCYTLIWMFITRSNFSTKS